MTPHRLAVRIYYEDTDFSGNVYHAAYLKFFERGRTEFLRDLRIHHSELMAEGLAFAVRRMTIDFVAPAHIDDLLTVTTQVVKVGGARLLLAQIISRGTRCSPAPRWKWPPSAPVVGRRACPERCAPCWAAERVPTLFFNQFLTIIAAKGPMVRASGRKARHCGAFLLILTDFDPIA